MEKFFIPFVIAVFLISTIAVTAIGQDYIKKNQGAEICVESRSCAVNYMNNMEKED